jgi:bla regulator protein BlaR1
MLTLLSSSPFLTSLSLTLLHFLWQGLLVAAVLKSALLIFNSYKPQLRYALSALAMAVNLLLPIITFAIIYQTESSPTNIIANSLALSEFIQELKQPDAFFSYKEFTVLSPSLLPYIAILWLATIPLLAGKLLLEVYNVNNLSKQNTVAPSQKLQARFNKLAKQIHLAIRPQLLISLTVEVPMAIGWLKPVVLLPASMVTGLSTSQLEMLLLHELGHIRRHDYLANFFQTLVEILLFFHPSVHWVSKQMRNEREYCSDDIAVKHCGDAIAYAHTLVDTASLCTKAHHHTIPDLAMAASGGDLKQRVIRLVDRHCAPKNNISKWFASVIIVFSVLILSSKQILTIPLLDIWSNERPSQHSNNATKTQKNIIYTDNAMPNGSIAQQLLNLPEDKSNIVRTIDFKTTLISPDSLIQKLPNNMLSVILLENAPLTTNRSNHLNKELPNAVSSKVEQVFKPILSQNKSSLAAKPYQQEITTLAIVPVTKRAKAEQITTIRKSSYSELLADSSNVNNKKSNLTYTDNKKNIRSTFVDHISRQKKEWVQPIVIENKSISPITPVWQSAEQVKSVDPIYPSMAKRRGIEIEVKVNFTIDIEGQIKDIRFARHKKINYFENSIRKAIKKWRFIPAKVDEKPVESQMAKVFSFSLQS